MSAHDAWMRGSVEGQPMTGAFVTLVNGGQQSLRLIGGASPIAATVEIHTMETDENGVMRMRHLPEGIDLPPGENVSLEPGRVHLMLIGLHEHPATGRTVPLTLRFEGAGDLEIEFEVRSRADPDR